MSKHRPHKRKFNYETYESEEGWITPVGEYNIVHTDCPTKEEIQQRVTDFINEIVSGDGFDDDCLLCRHMAAHPYNVTYLCQQPCFECKKAKICKNFDPDSKQKWEQMKKEAEEHSKKTTEELKKELGEDWLFNDDE